MWCDHKLILLIVGYTVFNNSLNSIKFGLGFYQIILMLSVAIGILIGMISSTATLLRAYMFSVGCSLILLALFVSTTNFWFALACATVLSTAQVGMNVAGQVMVQTTVAGQFRGRVMSLWGLLNRSGPAVGAILIGGLAEFAGFRWPQMAGVAICAVVAFFVYVKREEILKILLADKS